MMGTDIKGPQDIGENWPQFPEGCKSLLAKHLTKDVWFTLKDKSDKFGFGIRDAILSGAHNVESGVGVYSGSHDAYKVFAPLFDRIIEDYHGHKPEDKHISDMDYTKLNCPDLPADEDAMINSTRIRVARNLAAYPLGAGISK